MPHPSHATFVRPSIALLAIAGALFVIPRPARASCAPPPPAVVWSYPAEGQTDVPTNATIWILLPNWTQPATIMLDGQPLPVNDFGFGYALAQPLAPNTPHQVTFRATPARVQPAVELTIHFTTGAGAADATAPALPEIPEATVSATRDLAAECQGVVDAMECIDTGPREHLVFTTAATPLLWIVESVAEGSDAPSFKLWPGSCGPPEAFVEDAATRACNRRYRLHAFSAAGLSATTAPLCPGDLVKMPHPPPPAQDAGAGGGAGGGDFGGGSAPDAGAAPEPQPTGSDPAVHETDAGKSGCAVIGPGAASGGWSILCAAGALLVRRRRRRKSPPAPRA
jgi:hypothetical protein